MNELPPREFLEQYIRVTELLKKMISEIRQLERSRDAEHISPQEALELLKPLIGTSPEIRAYLKRKGWTPPQVAPGEAGEAPAAEASASSLPDESIDSPKNNPGPNETP